MSKEAKPDAWMPLYIGDWDGDTGHLDCEQDGAYGRLIRHYWRNGPLPDDDASLARIVRMELRQWKKVRPTLAPFFKVGDGVWRNKRADAEIVKWADKKVAAADKARAAAAKRWGKDARSMPQALLEQCPSSSSREVRAHNGALTLSGEDQFIGPKEVRQAFCEAMGDDWCRSYLDLCGWQDVPERALIPHTAHAGRKIVREARSVLAKQNLTVLEKAA